MARNGYSFAAAGKTKEKLVELIDVYPAIRKIEIVDLTVEADCNLLLANYDFFINCYADMTGLRVHQKTASVGAPWTLFFFGAFDFERHKLPRSG